MMEQSKFIRSVCCDAPVCLALLRHDLMTDSVPVVCSRCGKDIADAGMEDIFDADARVSQARLNWEFTKFRMHMMYSWAFIPFRTNPFLINPF